MDTIDSKRLTKRQLKAIEDMFENQLSEEQILEKYRLSKNVFQKWFKNEQFIDELNFKINWAKRQSRMIIARYGPLAAAKLVELTESEKPETARKACLDIIENIQKDHSFDAVESEKKSQKNDFTAKNSVSAAVANKILKVLAEHND